MKRAVILLATMATLLAFAGGAQAAVFGATINDAFVSNGRVVQITGRIACSAGDEFFLRVNVFDRDGNEAVGRASGTCTGNPQEWSTGAISSDTGFSCGELLGGHGQARSGGDQKSFSDRTQAVCFI